MWSALPAIAREYIYAHELPLHFAHINATEYDLPGQEVRVAGIAQEDGKILFVNSVKEDRDWELPGGRLEPGESVDDAICREFTEETGFAVRDARPALAMVWAFPDSTIVQLVFEVDHGGKVSEPGDEVSETEWFEDLPANISFGEEGYATYEFIVNNESVQVQMEDGLLAGVVGSPSVVKKRKSLALAGVAGGAAITAGLARRLLSNRRSNGRDDRRTSDE